RALAPAIALEATPWRCPEASRDSERRQEAVRPGGRNQPQHLDRVERTAVDHGRSSLSRERAGGLGGEHAPRQALLGLGLNRNDQAVTHVSVVPIFIDRGAPSG